MLRLLTICFAALLIGAAPLAAQIASEGTSPSPPKGDDPSGNADEQAVSDEESSDIEGPDEIPVGPAPEPPPPPPAPIPGPRYFDLRYDEDFSYLDGEPGTYKKDFFDPIKNIRFGEDWRLSIGGEFRFRMEAESNFGFGAVELSQDTFTLYRYFLHADLKYRRLFRIYVQGASMHEEDRDRLGRAFDENQLALQQLFVDIRPLGDGTPLVFRTGRQELSYGAQRFVSPLDWANTRRRFDAAKVFWKADTWQFDAFYSKPVFPIRRTKFDQWDEEYDFYGAFFSYHGIPRHGLQGFFYAQDDTLNRVNPNGRVGDMSRFTFGGRFFGKSIGFDYDAFLVGQWGTWAGDRIQAWAWGLDGGYTFGDVPWKPRIGAGFDWASGDRDPNDGTVETFDQLFPLGHKYLGFMDFFARQNVVAPNVNLTAWPIPKKVRTTLAYYAFWLESKDDAHYNVGGVPGRRDRTGSSGNQVGEEIDFTILWKIDVHSALLFGYSHFFTDNFLQSTGPSDDADFYYLQYSFDF